MDLFQEDSITNVKKYQLKSLDTVRIFLFILFGILSFGLFWLICFWIEDLLYFLYSDETDIWKADYILFHRKDNQKLLIPIQKSKCKISPYSPTRHVLFLRYEGQIYYYSTHKIFKPVKDQVISYILNNPQEEPNIIAGLEENDVRNLIMLYEKNQMDIVVYPFLLKSLLEILKPINMTQVFISLVFWYVERFIYASIVFFYVLITVFLNSYEYTSNRKKLQKISKANVNSILVRRSKDKEDMSRKIAVENLVIGDIVELESGLTFPCDLLLLQGTCLVNEALLTGESVPILKQGFKISEGKKENVSKGFLFGGTKLIHKKSDFALAVVVGTGWNTRKGQLLGSVLYANEETDRF